MIYLGADHAGYKLKEEVKKFLESSGLKYEDMGTDSESPVDYPDYAFSVARKVVGEENSRGILICGTGTGMAIAANRVKGVRAVAAYDSYSAKMARVDNDSNVLTLRGKDFDFGKVKEILNIWLETGFAKATRHERRIRKLDR